MIYCLVVAILLVSSVTPEEAVEAAQKANQIERLRLIHRSIIEAHEIAEMIEVKLLNGKFSGGEFVFYCATIEHKFTRHYVTQYFADYWSIKWTKDRFDEWEVRLTPLKPIKRRATGSTP